MVLIRLPSACCLPGQAALGLIPDYKGSLKVLGAEARDADKPSLAAAVAYAQQAPFVLTGSLRDNLLLAQPGGSSAASATDDELHGALEQVIIIIYSIGLLLLPMIIITPNRPGALEQACLGPGEHSWAYGLDTHIHEGGRNLSGGQQQRLALARIFLQRDARLIVLDEATSALDNATEARLIENLHAHAAEGGRTVLMVAHRLTTMRRADRVLVMEAGQIVQEGGFSELSEKDGVFRELLSASTG